MRTSQFNIFVETYVLLKDKNDLTHINKTTPAWVENRLGEKYGGDVLRINFQPITDIHLNNFLPTGIEPISNPKYSYILLTIGMLIIVVACINYIILSVSLSTKRSLEVGIRKVLGANSPQLVRQFFGESFVLTVVSMVLGFILMFIFYKPFIYLVGKELDVQFDLRLILFCTILCGLIGLLSGLYPAVLISRHNILLAIKGKIRFANSRSFFRKGLIGLQFVLSIGLIICAVGVDSQLNYLKRG
jgi:putative ABC transport system permease protein